MQELKTLSPIAQLMPLERVREVAARHALNADQHGVLAAEVVEALTCAGFSRYFVPKERGGTPAPSSNCHSGSWRWPRHARRLPGAPLSRRSWDAWLPIFR